MKPIQVSVIVPGRFHLFKLAEQLEKRGMFFQLITSYSKRWVSKTSGLPLKKVDSIFIKEILQRLWVLIPPRLRDWYDPEQILHKIFDYFSAKKIKTADIVVGMPASFPLTLRKAKKNGSIVILENGSSHSLYQYNIMREEYSRFNITPPLFVVSDFEIIQNNILAYGEVDYISVPSTFVKKTFLDKGIPESKLIKVPYGVDLSQFRQIPKEDKIFRVIFAGGMTLRKGVHYLLQAFYELKLPNSELLLVGAYNEDMDYFFKKYNGYFKWIGHVPQAELYKYYSQGSVFCMPSLEEGMAMVQAQAMACGLPLICTTNTGGEDLIREGVDGFTVPIRDVNKLKEKIKFLYDNPEVCKQMGQSAKEHISKGFTWDDYGDKIVREYERIYRG
jgi:glycosyltransferase involved in cell wall biosynthesis